MSRMTFGACLLVASVTVAAQTSHRRAPVPPTRPHGRRVSVRCRDDMMRFVSSELGARSVIKGAPYSATAVNETPRC